MTHRTLDQSPGDPVAERNLSITCRNRQEYQMCLASARMYFTVEDKEDGAWIMHQGEKKLIIKKPQSLAATGAFLSNKDKLK